MAKVIWKYPLLMGVEFALEMPEGAEAMTVQIQPGHDLDNQPVLWALVDPHKPMEMRLFRIYGTGDPIEGKVDLFGYLGTWQADGDVWHLFEVLPEVAFELPGSHNIREVYDADHE